MSHDLVHAPKVVMSDFTPDPRIARPGSEAGASASLQNELGAILRIVTRHARLILIMGAVSLLVAVGYAYTQPVIYRATAQINLDPRRMALSTPVNTQGMRRDEPMIDSGRADSEAEVIKSERIIRSVVLTLDLVNAPEFNRPPSGFSFRRLLAGSQTTTKPTEEDRILDVVAAVGLGLSVNRIDKSYVINVSYDAENPVFAARVANGFIEAYIRDQFDSNAETGQLAANWLKSRLKQLGEQARAADAEAVNFRRDNNIALVGGASIDEQQLSTLSTQLAEAVAKKADAKAHLDRIAELDPKSEDVLLSDAFKNDVVTRLRQKYLENAGRVNALAERYGANHNAVVKMRSENDALAEAIRNEMRRYEESYRSDYEIAVSRENAIRASLAQQFEKTLAIGDKQVKLNELDSTVKTLRTSYEAALQRFTDSVQKMSFPVSEARIISNALPPTGKFKPKRGVIAVVGGAGGLALGLILAFAFELTSKRIRTRQEAEAVTGVACLAYVPRLTVNTTANSIIEPGTARDPTKPISIRPGGPGSSILDYVARNPFSVTAEAMRSIKTAIDVMPKRQRARVVGVVSALPNEGKTSVAGNLAHLLAIGRSRVLLIDCDLRNPSLSRTLGLRKQSGLLDVLMKGTRINEVAVSMPRVNLDIIPMNPTGIGAQSVEVLGSDPMQALLGAAGRLYDYVILDLPPLLPVVDAKTVEPMVDSFVMVIDWGTTSSDVVKDALGSAPRVWDKLAGTILNRTNFKILRRYGEHVDSYYNQNYFSDMELR